MSLAHSCHFVPWLVSGMGVGPIYCKFWHFLTLIVALYTKTVFQLILHILRYNVAQCINYMPTRDVWVSCQYYFFTIFLYYLLVVDVNLLLVEVDCDLLAAAKRNTSLWSHWTQPRSWSDSCWLGARSTVVKTLWTLVCRSQSRCRNAVTVLLVLSRAVFVKF